MTFRRRLVWTVLTFTLLALALAWSRSRSRHESIVRGRPVSAWASALLGPEPTGPAEEVFRSLGPEAVPDLVRLLQHNDSLLRHPLNTITPRLSARVSTRLHRIFKVDDPGRDRVAAVLALGWMGTNAAAAIPALVEALEDNQIAVSMRAGTDLGRIGPASLPGLLKALDSPRDSARHAALGGLLHLGTAAAPAVPRLTAMLATPADRPHVRPVLQSIGSQAVPALAALLRESPEELRIEAIGLLGSIGPLARDALPALSGLASGQSRTARHQTIQALGQICASCEPATTALRRALEDESSDVRHLAAGFLAGDSRAAEATVKVLLNTLDNGSGHEKASAIASLGLLGTAAAPAIPALQKIAESGPPDLGASARASLRQIEGDKESHR